MVKEIHETQGVSGRIRLELGPDKPKDREDVGAVMIFLFDRGRLIMSRHPHRAWEFPGGKIEPGESPEEAAWRETIEEIGATLKNVRPIGFQTVLARDGSRWVTKLFSPPCGCFRHSNNAGSDNPPRHPGLKGGIHL